MSSIQQDIDERTNLTGSNKFEMLLFRLGDTAGSDRSELFGINVFKIREIVAMPPVTAMAGSPPNVLGVVNLRGQVIPVIDLPAVVGCVPKTGLNIMLVTEYARSTQAFAAESVEDIVRLDWNQILSADNSVASGMVTSIARLDGNDSSTTRLAQILDVESILSNVLPTDAAPVTEDLVGPAVRIKTGSVVLAADDSFVARSLIERELQVLELPYLMTKTGQEAWDKLQSIAADCQSKGIPVQDKVALVLTDLEMPEMDGFTLTRNIKKDPRMRGIPVVIHSSLTGDANENHVRTAGADAYVAKFAAEELATALRNVLAKYDAHRASGG
jgi:two-component system, chemotaxis family, chemotaxis protein CheV